MNCYGVDLRFCFIHVHFTQELGGDLEDALEPPPRTNGSASVLTHKMEGLTMTPPSALPPHHMAAASPHGPLTVQTAGPPLTPGGPAYPGHYAPHHLLPPSAFASAGPALQVRNGSFKDAQTLLLASSNIIHFRIPPSCQWCQE